MGLSLGGGALLDLPVGIGLIRRGNGVVIATSVVPVSPIEFVASNATAGAGNHTVTIPASVLEGDLLLLETAQSSAGAVTAPTGWTHDRNGVRNATLDTNSFSKIASSSDAGTTVTVTNPATNTAAAVTAYRHVASVNDRESRFDQNGTAVIASPVADAAADTSWHHAVFFERSSGVTDLTPPAGGTERSKAIGTGGGHVSILVTTRTVDSGPVDQLEASTVGANASRAVGHSTILTPLSGAGGGASAGFGNDFGNDFGS